MAPLGRRRTGARRGLDEKERRKEKTKRTRFIECVKPGRSGGHYFSTAAPCFPSPGGLRRTELDEEERRENRRGKTCDLPGVFSSGKWRYYLGGFCGFIFASFGVESFGKNLVRRKGREMRRKGFFFSVLAKGHGGCLCIYLFIYFWLCSSGNEARKKGKVVRTIGRLSQNQDFARFSSYFHIPRPWVQARRSGRGNI